MLQWNGACMWEWLFEALAKLVGHILLYFILLPPTLILATPVILIRSLVWPGRIRSDYESVVDFWSRYLWVL